jgi:hypothetical protein
MNPILVCCLVSWLENFGSLKIICSKQRPDSYQISNEPPQGLGSWLMVLDS